MVKHPSRKRADLRVLGVRIPHPPLRFFDNLMADLAAIAQRNERPVVNRKVMGSTPIGGVCATAPRSSVDLA